jgi:hypothetical protein
MESRNGEDAWVPIWVELRTSRGDALRGLPDPSGGTFDAAGDFDRLLARADGILRSVDPYGNTTFNALQMADLLAEIARLVESADVSALERQGLDRLRVIGEQCRDGTHLHVWFIGD